MSIPPSKPFLPMLSRVLLSFVIFGSILAITPSAFAQTDASINANVWKMIYGVTDAQINQTGIYANPSALYPNGWLAGDDDGDGVSNGDELRAGTNPFKPNSTLVVASVTSTPTTISMTFPTVSQKLYTVQATQTLNPVSWSPVAGVFVVGDGTQKTLTATKGTNKYFRVVVQDQSTANDNVSDWAKQFLGFALGSPISAQSAFVDNNALASALGGQNVVTVTATDASTTQPSTNIVASADLGTFTITRSGYFLLSQITVNLSAGGTAVPGVDYTPLPSTITFPAGIKTQTISVVPKYNPARSTSATVLLTLSGSAGFTVGTPASATVTIYPADLSYGTGLKGAYYTGSSATYRSTSLGNNNLGGVAAVYSYTQNSSTSGTGTVSHGGLAPTSVGSIVYLSFTSGVGTPNLSTTGVLPSGTTGALYDKAYVVMAATNPAPLTVPFTIGNPIITKANHGLTVGTPVSFTTTGTLPTGLAPGTTYYVISTGFTTGQFEVSATFGGSAITPSGTQSGTHSVNSGNFTVAITGTSLPASDTAGSSQCFISAVNAPTATRLDSTVDFTWNYGLPSSGTGALPTSTSNNWVGRFDGYLTAPTTGTTYQFQVQADDGARVYIDLNNNGFFTDSGDTIIDAWTSGLSTYAPVVSGNVSLTTGTRYHVRVEYLQLNQSASISLQWKKPGDASFSNIPSANVYLDGTTATNGWTNQYWSNTSFAGLPRFADYPNQINLNWGTGAPSQTLPAVDTFSVRWEGYVSSFNGGTYNFQATADDGAVVYIDLNQNGTFDGGSETALTTVAGTGTSGNVVLAAGQRYKMRVDFSETTGSALVNVGWKRSTDTVYSLLNASAVQTADNLTVYRDSGATNFTGWWASYYPNSTFTDPPLYSAQDTNANSLSGGTSAVAISIASPAVVSWSAHGLAANTPVVFTTTGTLPTGLTAGTTYYVMTAGWSANSFQVSTSQGSATPVNTSGTQSGTQTATASAGYTYGASKPGGSGITTGGSGNDNWGTRFDAYLKETAGGGPYQFQTSVQPGSPLSAGIDFARLVIDGAEVIPNNSGTTASAVTIPVASPAVITWTGHNLSANMPVVFASTSTLPTGLTAGTTYYVISAGLTANSFEVSTSVGGSAVNATVAGTGTYSAAAGASAPVSVSLTSGQIAHLVFEHYNFSGNANPALYWKKPGDLTFTLLPATNLYRDAAATTSPGVTASYWTNTSFYGIASFTNYLTQIAFSAANGGVPSQVINADNFSARWETYIRPSVGGNISFDIQADDAARVYLDVNQNGSFEEGPMVFYSDVANTQAVDPWVAGASTAAPVHSGTYALVAGQRYKLRVEFTDASGAAVAKLRWMGDGTSTMAGIPNTNLYLDATTAQLGVMASYYSNTTLTDPPAYMVAENANPGVTYDFGSGRPVVVPQSNVTISIGTGATVAWPAHGLAANTPVVFTTTGALPGGLSAATTYYVVGGATLLTNSFQISTAPGGAAITTSGTQSGVQTAATIGFDNFSVRWTGQILPQYSETYYIDGRVDDGVRIWVNNQLVVNRWPGGGVTDTIGTIDLIAGVRYDIVAEYYEATGASEAHLYWWSNSQAKQIIPTSRLFPTLTGSPAWTVAATTTGGGTAGTSTIIVGNTGGIGVGQTVSGTNVPVGATVTGVDTTTGTITLSSAISTSVTNGTSLSFATPVALPAITSPSAVVALMGSGTPFSYTITASNGGGNFTANPLQLPPGIGFSNGVFSGTPTAAGDYQVTITAANAAGTVTSVLDILVVNAGGKYTRDLWNSATAYSAFSIAPNSFSDVSAAGLEDTNTYGDNSGQRLRGYIIPPVTGNYYFWIAANNQADLWISTSSEPINVVQRAYVTADTGSQNWTVQSTQKSPWLALIGGQRYYYEVRHLCPVGSASDYVAVGYVQDSTGNGATLPSGPIPPSMLAPFDYPVTTSVAGTLYTTTLTPANGVTTNASGYSYIRLNQAQNQAIVHFSYGGLSYPAVQVGIFGAGGALLFDVTGTDKFHPDLKTADGGYTWNLNAGAVTQLVNGTAFFSVLTAQPGQTAAEVNGLYESVVGSQVAPATPSYPTWTDDSNTDIGASRFLAQATFGASQADINALKNLTPSASYGSRYRTWIDNQLALGSNSHIVPDVLANLSYNTMFPYPDTLFFNSWWKNAMTAPDQLRQRFAFAMSEILVTSDQGPLNNNARILADYYDNLVDYGLPTTTISGSGIFRNMLKQITLTPAMGLYLDMLNNSKGDLTIGRSANENYAREIMQLFSIGLYRLWPDGTLMLDSQGNPIPTYTQAEISGVAKVFTGWSYGNTLNNGRLPTGGANADYLDPMVLGTGNHDLGSKRILYNIMLPPATITSQSDTSTVSAGQGVVVQTVDPVLGQGNLVSTEIVNKYDLYGLKELETVHDVICNSSSVGPFICRQLIQRLVTSNPKPAYLYRVVQAFNGERNVDGVATGVRGNMADVIRAILLDSEARDATAAADVTFGKQREPLLRVTGPARAFRVTSPLSGTYAQDEFASAGVLKTLAYQITVTATNHRLIANDSILLNFTSATTGVLPSSQYSYTVQSTPAPTANTFVVNASGWDTGVVWKQTNGVSDTAAGNVITVTNRGWSTSNSGNDGYKAGAKIYVKFTRTGATNDVTPANDTVAGGVPPDGVYTIASNPTTGAFTFTVSSSWLRTSTSNQLMVAKLTAGYTVGANPNTADQNDIVITCATFGRHDLAVNDHVWLDFTGAPTPLAPADGEYVVATVIDDDHFTVLGSNASATSYPNLVVYPLVKPPIVRTGSLSVQQSTYNMGSTTGQSTTADLNQSPLNSPTVFNFFYPDFRYPGTGSLATAQLTVPEFQLTTDSNLVLLQNFLNQGFLSAGNTNGYTSFKAGNDTLVMDLSSTAPFSTADTSTTTGVNALIDSLNTLLCAGQLNSGTKDAIRNYILYSKAITSISSPGTATFTVAGHGLSVGEVVTISGVGGGTYSGASTSANGTFTVLAVTANTFTLWNGTTALSCSGSPTPAQLTGSAVTLFPTSSGTNVRDRIRAIVHLIISSAEYTIQK